MAALDFNPLDFLKEECSTEQANIRIPAISKLKLIAAAIGPSQTASDLVPYLNQTIKHKDFVDDEEFLCKVAAGLGELPEFMDPGAYAILIPPLEYLCAQEETIIRATAVDSLCSIVSKKKDLAPTLKECMQNLATKSEHFFTARVSACSLFPTAYEYSAPAEHEAMRQTFIQLCNDETPMVRRAAATSMTDLAKVFCNIRQPMPQDLLDCYQQLSKEDTQDTIRVSCISTTIELAKMLDDEANKSYTVAVIQDGTQDRSWRVKLTVAKSFPELCSAYSKNMVNDYLLECQRRLLQDAEFEVRKEALLAVKRCIDEDIRTCDQKEISTMIPTLLRLHDPQSIFQKFSVDSSHQVRAAFAKLLGPLVKKVYCTPGSEIEGCSRKSVADVLLYEINNLLKDEQHEVRLPCVQNIGIFCEMLDKRIVQVETESNIITGLMMDNHWRIREAVAEQMPSLARCWKHEFTARLLPQLLNCFKDAVYEVRKTAVEQLRDLVKEFGQQWTIDKLAPQIYEMLASKEGYSKRITALKALAIISPAFQTPDKVHEYVVEQVVMRTADSVPNVRLQAVKVLKEIDDEFPAIYKYKPDRKPDFSIVKVLDDLTKDTDYDVQYQASLTKKELDDKGSL
jgi:serine/threonine-protein phosphatase 2A regulatory subunit A